MAGILERMGWSQKRASENSFLTIKVDRKLLELQTAEDILAEIFGVSVSEVKEMILNRYEEVCDRDNSPDEWPREFWIGENAD